MGFKLSYFHISCALTASLTSLMYIYPIIFYIFVFVLYSLFLIICGESSSIELTENNTLFYFPLQYCSYSKVETKEMPSNRFRPQPFYLMLRGMYSYIDNQGHCRSVDSKMSCDLIFCIPF